MKKLTPLLIAIMTGTIIGNVHLDLVKASTPVNGIIVSDITWTQSNSPYSLTSNILVNSGVTLTIEGGVIVNFNNNYMRINGSLIIEPGVTINMELIGDGIQVNGILSAIGTNANPVHFNGSSQGHNFPTPFKSYSTITFAPSSTGWNQKTDSGSIIENAIFTNTELEVSSGMRIGNNDFLSGALTLLGGLPAILNDNIATGIVFIGGSPVISNNNIPGGLYIGAGSGVVTNNVISA